MVGQKNLAGLQPFCLAFVAVINDWYKTFNTIQLVKRTDQQNAVAFPSSQISALLGEGPLLNRAGRIGAVEKLQQGPVGVFAG